MIRAKFVVEAVTKFQGGDVLVKARAVTSGKGNESWSKFTPSGELSMTISSPEAQTFLVAGKTYYLDFSEAE